MRIAISNDHAGFVLKPHVKEFLESIGHDVIDVGTQNDDPVDFPVMTQRVTALVTSGEADRGILVCGTGVGAAIAANCQPCLQSTTTMALESGADEQEIAEAIEVGKMVRQGAASKMDRFATSLNYVVPSAAHVTQNYCECGS